MIRQKKLALQRKRLKAVALALAVLAIIVIAAVCISKSDKNNVEPEITTYVEYYVKSGDTLWGIAKAHSNNNVDLREFIREIEEKNQLTSDFIYCGDVLLVPARYSCE